MAMNNNRVMGLVGEILSRCGALGDAKLSGLMGELMSEISKAPETPTVAVPGKYVVCVEATMKDGTKVQHPLIGGYAVPTSIDGYQMMVGDNLVALQSETQGMAAAVVSRYRNVHVRYVPVTDEALATLEEKLRKLLTDLVDAINKAADAKAEAYGMMNVNVESEDITDEMVADVIRKTLYAGAALTEDGQVVDRNEGETYVEEDEIAGSDDGYDDYEDEDYEDEDYEDDEYEDDEYDDESDEDNE